MDELNQPTTPQASQTPDQMHSPSLEDSNGSGSKVIPFIIGAIILILVGVGSYVLGTKNSQPPVQKIVAPTPLPTEAPAKAGDPTANWKTYKDIDHGFEIKYPEKTSIGGNPNGSPNDILMTLPFQSGTNLMDKSLLIHIISNVNPAECSNPASDSSGIKKTPEIININGIEVKKETGGDVGAGNQYKSIDYSIAKGNTCFKLTFNLHTVTAQNFQPPVLEINKAKELQTFDRMISTFKFTN